MIFFNAVSFRICGIPGYAFWVIISVGISFPVFMLLLYKKGYALDVNVRIALFCAPILLLSARLFGCISGIYRDIGFAKDVTWNSVFNTGIVYFGGMLGLLLSYAFFSKKAGQDSFVLDVVATVIPLFHAFARIGCFFGGCCFGRKCESPLSVYYTTRVLGEIDASWRIPVQLFESFFNMLLFFYLLSLLREKHWKRRHILKRYLSIYSIGRFMLEFARGDAVRGTLFKVSFSQAICLIICCLLIVQHFHGNGEMVPS